MPPLSIDQVTKKLVLAKRPDRENLEIHPGRYLPILLLADKLPIASVQRLADRAHQMSAQRSISGQSWRCQWPLFECSATQAAHKQDHLTTLNNCIGTNSKRNHTSDDNDDIFNCKKSCQISRQEFKHEFRFDPPKRHLARLHDEAQWR